jgi:phage shock protein A
LSVFDGLRASIEDLLNGRVAPGDRAGQIREMKQALVYARLGTDDLRSGVSTTRGRLEAERRELATVRRRRELAAAIPDPETVSVAEKFEAQHAERIAVLENKLAAQEAELALAERELEEMTAQLRAAAKGVGDGPPPRAPDDAELGLPDDAPLRSELDGLRRAAEREAQARQAEDRLAELKKKMGR